MFNLSFIPTVSNHTERFFLRDISSLRFFLHRMTLGTSSVVVMPPLQMSSGEGVAVWGWVMAL